MEKMILKLFSVIKRKSIAVDLQASPVDGCQRLLRIRNGSYCSILRVFSLKRTKGVTFSDDKVGHPRGFCPQF
jgi:hypothetical protein